ncbi:glutamine synthetase III [Verrucomicrobiota bacterium]
MTSESNRKTKSTDTKHTDSPTDFYGENVFSVKIMRNYLSDKAFKSLCATICEGRSLDPGIADEVADAMKTWAISRGATHFTHWFQPLTGTTAEKHDSFIVPDQEGGVILHFSGKELTQGEPDASSFPSGGLRATFEARGYTAWDPTSPAFIREGANSSTLCIPTAFCGYHGEALDKKAPLLRSIDALSRQICRLAGLFGIKTDDKRTITQLGAEQEYFLIDRDFYESRLDLLQTGRTLFGKAPAKHQQMEDHYFGSIKSRVLAFMEDLDRELWRLGIPAKTRHNEVCPAQFEIAPVFEELNLAIDHNMLTMEILKETAELHDFVCLLHEKPFAGVNGSGKHNNWNVCGPDGRNWLKPGENPHENAKFLTIVCAVIKAVDQHANLLRASVATAGNDHRLGANEAPPAIISIFFGEQLTEVIEQIGGCGPKTAKSGGLINIGVSSLPPLPRDITDRNRTSPFAFTGSKFEFRAIGSNQSCADSNTVLNTIVADVIDEICSKLEQEANQGKEFNASLQSTLQEIVKNHKRVIFNGDNYTEEWQKEAKKRGLPNIKTTPEALKALTSESTAELFEKHSVLSHRELESRYEVYRKEYESIIKIEAECAITMVRTMIFPAAMRYADDLASCINEIAASDKASGMSVSGRLLKELTRLCEDALILSEKVEEKNQVSPEETIPAMNELRDTIDALEGLVPADFWPLPTYAEMMFI